MAIFKIWDIYKCKICDEIIIIDEGLVSRDNVDDLIMDWENAIRSGNADLKLTHGLCSSSKYDIFDGGPSNIIGRLECIGIKIEEVKKEGEE